MLWRRSIVPVTVELVDGGVVSLPDRNETFPAIDPVDGAFWFLVGGGRLWG